MSLASGRRYLAIPGPSVMPDAVLNAMHRAAPDIYQGELVDMMPSVMADLKRVARTSQRAAIYIGNGHAAWEAALANVLAEGDHVLMPATGRFGHGWAEMATGLGAEVQMIDFGRRSPLDAGQVEAALRADKAHKIKAVMVTHVDTSSGVLNDLQAVRAAIAAARHPALLMADCIASMGCDRFEFDAWDVDVAVSASQKGFMVPPGLGFVFFSDRAAEVRRALPRVSRYWDWTVRGNPEFLYQYFGGTAPTHHILGMRAALDMIHAEGVEAVWARHDTLARAIWAACEAWGSAGPLELNVADPAHRSRAVTALRIGRPSGVELRRWCEQEAGVTLGVGLGMGTPEDPDSEGFFRIGHMGHVNAQMVMGMLGSVAAAMAALEIPHGAGGLEAAAKVIAGR